MRKTTLCKYGSSCSRDDCNFAHGSHDIKVIPCKFDGRCANRSCIFFHKGQSIDEYVLRRGGDKNYLKNCNAHEGTTSDNSCEDDTIKSLIDSTDPKSSYQCIDTSTLSQDIKNSGKISLKIEYEKNTHDEVVFESLITLAKAAGLSIQIIHE